MTLTARLRALLATALLAGGLAVPAAAAEPLKIGFVYVTPIADVGWTHQHDEGRKAVEAALGDAVTTVEVASVGEGPDAERVIRQLAESGAGLIFATSFGYMNPTIKVAAAFPGVRFEHAGGYKRSDNVGTYLARFYEARYLTGVVAGRMTRSNVFGYIAAFPIPEVVRGINAFTLGVRSVNPAAQVKVIWLNSWFDPGKERDAAEALVAQGADVLAYHTDSPATARTAEEKQVRLVGYHSDMSTYAPTMQLTAATHHWGAFYTRVAQAVIDGTWTSSDVWGGLADGMVDIAPLAADVPAEVADLVARRRAAIVAGSLHPFAGPIRDQSGTERVPAGAVMDEGAMLGFDWFVEGVQGTIPR
ncbi:BMP family ABC transporter substrate-binding protein [Oceanibacterium hippocampi]|uniref:Purine-binding protein n=1 Tax=Oceanibacterium hippocampi TaxID=745714 RepID=A0A1Y5T580_9PROT|nr:BMP family ABC transporter substrate-binding protein [Oceanibacterium hippocampi]SLN55718.1 Purine-binding protein precursor [Oceanibacterium hippocampi]